MPAATTPIFTIVPNVGGIGTVLTSAANTAFDGTGTVVTTFTAGANGSYVQNITWNPGNGVSNNVATVARVFLNNGNSTATSTNNLFIGEVTLPATTGVQNAALPPIVLPLNFPIQENYRLTWCLGTAVVAGYWAHAIGGDY
jgi:hypothetical protein